MYTKLYRTIFDGSLYGQFEAITVFMAMLALADHHGEVDAFPAKIAGCLGCDVDFVIKGIEDLLLPDPHSRTPAKDGCRIIPLLNDEGNDRPFGWKIVNYKKYREIRNEEERREYQRKWIEKKRKKEKLSTENVDDCQQSTNVDRSLPQSTHTDTDTDTEKIKTLSRFTRPSVKDVSDYCLQRKNSVDAQAFVDHYETNGWVQGKGKPIKNWKAAVRTWEKNQKPGTTVRKQPSALDGVVF